jgi:hypothetical protein
MYNSRKNQRHVKNEGRSYEIPALSESSRYIGMLSSS